MRYLFASNIKAHTPAVKGDDIDVPERAAKGYFLLLNVTVVVVVPLKVLVKLEIALMIDTPGAATSGFLRPSIMPPKLEKEAISPPITRPLTVKDGLYAATEITHSTLAGVPMP